MEHVRYRFYLLVDELRSSQSEKVMCSTFVLINCIINSEETLQQRVLLREEFIGKTSIVTALSHVRRVRPGMSFIL